MAETEKTTPSPLALEPILASLETTTPRPSRLQTPPSPTESFLGLYQGGFPPQFFINAAPSEQDPQVNINALEAHDFILQILTTTPGTVGTIEGPMGSCKTTLLAELAKISPNTQVFKHGNDQQRFETNTLVTQSQAGGRDTGIPARIYTGGKDLMEQINFFDGAIVLIDEWQFAAADEHSLNQLIKKAETTGTTLIFAQLNTDFARRPWDNGQLLKPHIDLFRIVLAARCSTPDCPHPALFSMRSVTLPDGRTRPAHTQEPVKQIGSITNTYAPTCHYHHQVIRPEDAKLFDAGHSPDDSLVSPPLGPGQQIITFWHKDPHAAKPPPPIT